MGRISQELSKGNDDFLPYEKNMKNPELTLLNIYRRKIQGVIDERILQKINNLITKI